MRRAVVLAGALIGVACFATAAHAGGDVKRGADVFDGQCGECHSVKPGKNRKGPTLYGVVGRKAGTVPDFEYSGALKSSALVWSADTISRYVASPRTVIPGGKMKFDGTLSGQEIVDLVTFLSSLQ